MTIFEKYFPLGLGTMYFPVSGPKDEAGIEKSAKIVLAALDAGVNYIDTALTYSAGAAPDILKKVFSRTKKSFDVTVKINYRLDKTSDETRIKVEQSLDAMGLERAKFFFCWTILSYLEFEKIIARGGVYDGAVKLRDEGLIDHICFSTHAPPEDIIKIIESGAFEGVTISSSSLHAVLMQPVLDTAQKHNIGVAVMNPLGGGIIAQNSGYFSFTKGDDDSSTAIAALRFAKAHPAVNIVLSAPSTEDELRENITAFTEKSAEPEDKRLSRVLRNVKDLRGFCTGCNYCDGCPKGIVVSQFMQARNAFLFDPVASYSRVKPDELLYNIQLFRKLQFEFGYFPETPENPCTGCGQCEAKCTQKLKIAEALDDTFKRAAQSGFSLDARKKRIEELLVGKGYKRVGVYPDGRFVAKLITELYRRFFGEPDFELLQFNSDPKMWGKTSGRFIVHSPEEIKALKPDIIVVTTYRFDREIYDSLRQYEPEGIRIVKLHKDSDVPWLF